MLGLEIGLGKVGVEAGIGIWVRLGLGICVFLRRCFF